MTCTWRDCTDVGIHSEVGRDGREWALLCTKHHDELDKHMESLEPRRLLGAWAKAGSGHPERKRMTKEIAAGAGRIVQAFNAAKDNGDTN